MKLYVETVSFFSNESAEFSWVQFNVALVKEEYWSY